MTVTAAAWMILAMVTMGSSAEGQIVKTTDVTVTNWLSKGQDLTMHCKSKEDDLGERVLHKLGTFSWHFIPNFFGRTLFFCSFSWDGSGGNRYFDIYVEKRDKDRCTDCKWIVSEAGPCWYNATSAAYDVCYGYKSSLL
ncbi:unnamed protein product [Linum tenue]|uniref:S-protein homolog n=2 Tax=Linum tenue TaxID=586396 RepID=A0AAV0PIG3_9ROSI|nr:unnamed protein product [Linum tenue]